MESNSGSVYFFELMLFENSIGHFVYIRSQTYARSQRRMIEVSAQQAKYFEFL